MARKTVEVRKPRDIGDAIRAVREARGISQEELAQMRWSSVLASSASRKRGISALTKHSSTESLDFIKILG
jgi:transcriptional regulator with XRE-family HTH domain